MWPASSASGETHVGLAPPGTTWQLSLPTAGPLCVLPHPLDPLLGPTLPGGVRGTAPAAWIQPLPPTGHASPTHRHPSQTAPSSTHALLVRPEKAAKPGPRPCSCPLPSACPPQDMHSQVGRTWVLQLPVHSKVIRTLTPLPTPTLCSLLGSASSTLWTPNPHPS